MIGSLTLLAQAFLFFAVMTTLFHWRRKLGVGVFVCAIGVMHFVETYLAAVFFIQLPFGLISPGSTVMFTGKLAMILLLYIKEDAETVRQPIYGLLMGNALMVALVLILRFVEPSSEGPSGHPDLGFLDQMGLLMIWGTLLLFIDSIALILLYERLRKYLPNQFIPRAFISLAVILTFDQLLFFAGLRFLTGTPITALVGGWTAKLGAALVYSLMVGAYLRSVAEPLPDGKGPPIADIFAKLTYRQRYEDLLEKSGTDALTGVLNRERFQSLGRSIFARAAASGRPLSLAVVDIDHFKHVNDHHGHLVGDEVLRRVGQVLRDCVRVDDKIFRYGGEEFVVLWDGLAHESALTNAERLRAAVPKALEKILPTPVTISIGVATSPMDATSLQDLFKQADVRMYDAKHEGRNRVVGQRPASGAATPNHTPL